MGNLNGKGRQCAWIGPFRHRLWRQMVCGDVIAELTIHVEL